jgi:hypothetical protein
VLEASQARKQCWEVFWATFVISKQRRRVFSTRHWRCVNHSPLQLLDRGPLNLKPHGLLFTPASAVTSTTSQEKRSGCLKVRPSLPFKSSPLVEIYCHLKQEKKQRNSSWF